MDAQNFAVLSITCFFELHNKIVMSKAKKSPTEKTYARLKDMFGSHHNLSAKHNDLKVHKRMFIE